MGEEPNRQREGADEVGQQLDRHQQHEQNYRHPLGHEQPQEMKAVPDDADDRHADKHHSGERESDDDVAGYREAVRNQAEQVAEQDEHEQREHEWEEIPRAMPGIGIDHIGDEFVGHLGDRLPSPGHQRRLARAEHGQRGDQHHRDRHQQRRIGIGDVEPADMERDEALDRELLEGLKLYRHAMPRRRPNRPSPVAPRDRPWRAVESRPPS